jgi:hypothetical protein
MQVFTRRWLLATAMAAMAVATTLVGCAQPDINAYRS